MRQNANRGGWVKAGGLLLCLGGLGAGLTGCNNESSPQQNQEIRQQAADATRDVKKGARELAGQAKVAAGNAVKGVDAVAQGVKQGAQSNGPETTGDLVDINSASTAKLAALPGISLGKAHAIVNGRPYDNAHALVSRGVLSQEQYDRIADRISAK
jgi:DNA uptake protein ComE-like DNA-binding protein